MKWTRENAYDTEILSALGIWGLDASVYYPITKAIIGAESGFSPCAYRIEAKIGDASRGLMQILLGTARAVGYKGVPGTVEECRAGLQNGLFDPKVNLTWGVGYFAQQLRRYNMDTWKAVAAYNYGSARIATVPTTICLARDTTGKCVQSFTAQPGQFYNQPYVNKVIGYANYFGSLALPPPDPWGGQPLYEGPTEPMLPPDTPPDVGVDTGGGYVFGGADGVTIDATTAALVLGGVLVGLVLLRG